MKKEKNCEIEIFEKKTLSDRILKVCDYEAMISLKSDAKSGYHQLSNNSKSTANKYTLTAIQD